MALRVLLADESVTIKKVIQLALQDFAVEVKAVPVGLDVLEVSKSFQPDLVFADILLQKRSGYEVCADLKKDPTTAAIPVVLMWSSFMELDQRQVDACGADGRLEQPFDVEALRKLVLELVPRTRSQRLAHFLEYPATVSAPLREKPAAAPAVSISSAPSPMGSVSTAAAAVAAKSAEPPPRPEIPKPKSPPPLSTPKAPASNPFGGTLGAGAPKPKPPSSPKPSAPPPVAAPLVPPSELEPGDMTPTPAIPERPSNDAPLGALPDLQLEGNYDATATGAKTKDPLSSGWNMESFEPLDLSPLSLADDEADDEAFQPIQLPQVEPAPAPATFGAALSLATEDDDDAEADQWSNSSLDKYRLPPLQPEESLAVDESTPDYGVSKTVSQVTSRTPTPPPSTTENTEIIPQDDVPEFALSSDEFHQTSRLEIEPVDLSEKTKPEIVRELLRDPDFSFSNEMVRDELVRDETIRPKPSAPPRGRAPSDHENAIDLSRAGMPPEDRIEAMVRNQVEKIVSQMLPQIAEKIIKRELERLLEES